jgi:hypothetical protein
MQNEKCIKPNRTTLLQPQARCRLVPLVTGRSPTTYRPPPPSDCFSATGSIFLPGLLLALVQLGGCRFAGDLVAAAAGGASAAASGNPAVGIAIGIGVQAGLDATVSYSVRKCQQAEQDAIENVVATMSDGERRLWKIEHDIPIGNEHGEVHVTRVFDTFLTSCKEIAFSVETGESPPISLTYTTDVCQWRPAEMGTRRVVTDCSLPDPGCSSSPASRATLLHVSARHQSVAAFMRCKALKCDRSPS